LLEIPEWRPRLELKWVCDLGNSARLDIIDLAGTELSLGCYIHPYRFVINSWMGNLDDKGAARDKNRKGSILLEIGPVIASIY